MAVLVTEHHFRKGFYGQKRWSHRREGNNERPSSLCFSELDEELRCVSGTNASTRQMKVHKAEPGFQGHFSIKSRCTFQHRLLTCLQARGKLACNELVFLRYAF